MAGGFGLVIEERVPVFGLVDAARFLGQRIASEGIGAGAGTAADLLEFAGSAFPFKAAGVAQGFEYGRVAIDICQRSFADVAGVDGQKAAGIDVADMGDEHEAFAVVDAARGPGPGARGGIGRRRAGLVGS